MKTLGKSLLLAAALALTAGHSPARAQDVAAAWERLTFPGEEFSVEWPDAPFVYVSSRKVKNTRDDYEKLVYFGTYADGVVFRLTSYHKPRRHESLAGLVRRPTDNLLLARPGVEVAAGGLNGMEYVLSGPHIGAGRVFRTKNHLYVLEAFGRDAPGESATRFLNSLTIGPNPAGRAIRTPEPPPSAPSADDTFSSREVEKKAVVVFKLEPSFTEEARKHNVSGLVRMRALLSSTGKVSNIQIVKGLPDGLTEQAIRAARCILFFPAEKGGRRVSQWVTLEYNFNIY